MVGLGELLFQGFLVRAHLWQDLCQGSSSGQNVFGVQGADNFPETHTLHNAPRPVVTCSRPGNSLYHLVDDFRAYGCVLLLNISATECTVQTDISREQPGQFYSSLRAKYVHAGEQSTPGLTVLIEV